MNQTLRSCVAGAAGAAVTLAVVLGQPALAAQVDKAKAQITSAMIKNGTIRSKDLDPKIKVSLKKANSALQGIPDASVTTPRLANLAVTNAKLADSSVGNVKLVDGSVSAAKIANGAVAASKLAPNSVSSNAIADGTLVADDIALIEGSAGFAAFTAVSGTCTASASIDTGHVVTGDYFLVSAPATVSGNITVTAREDALSTTSIDLVWCNNGNTDFAVPAATYNWAVIAE